MNPPASRGLKVMAEIGNGRLDLPPVQTRSVLGKQSQLAVCKDHRRRYTEAMTEAKKIPKNLYDLAKALGKLGYTITRQKSSHIRLTTQQNGQHHITVPDHDPVKVGTLSDILKDVADHLGFQRDELLERLFG